MLLRGYTAESGSIAVRAAAAVRLLELAEQKKAEIEDEPPIPLPSPNPGPQTVFRESTATIVWYGGALGGGKTFGLSSGCLNHYDNPLHRGVLLRRTEADAKKPGQLWEESREMYIPYGATSTDSKGMWHRFPSGAAVVVGGIQHEKNIDDWVGSQADFWGFDQLEQFLERMFWKIAMSRSRSMSGITPIIRATMNPVPLKDKVGGWVSEFLMGAGYVSRDTGFVVSEMDQKIRYFYQGIAGVTWYDSEEEALARNPKRAKRDPPSLPISFQFIEAKLEDNPPLEKADPGYRSRLEGMLWRDQLTLLHGNWLVSGGGGTLIDKDWIPILPYDPSKQNPAQPINERFFSARVRGWDIAGTSSEENPKADRTAGVICSIEKKSGRVVYSMPVAGQWSTAEIVPRIGEQMRLDGPGVEVCIVQDPAQAGKWQATQLPHLLREYAAEWGFPCAPIHVTVTPKKKKVVRATPMIGQMQPTQRKASGEISIRGNTVIVDSPNTEDCLSEWHSFDGGNTSPDDYTDAAADAYNRAIEMVAGSKKIGIL